MKSTFYLKIRILRITSSQRQKIHSSTHQHQSKLEEI